MRAITLLLGSGLICVTLAASTVAASAAKQITICPPKQGFCETGVVARAPIPGKYCKPYNLRGKYRGGYFCY